MDPPGLFFSRGSTIAPAVNRNAGAALESALEAD